MRIEFCESILYYWALYLCQTIMCACIICNYLYYRCVRIPTHSWWSGKTMEGCLGTGRRYNVRSSTRLDRWQISIHQSHSDCSNTGSGYVSCIIGQRKLYLSWHFLVYCFKIILIIFSAKLLHMDFLCNLLCGKNFCSVVNFLISCQTGSSPNYNCNRGQIAWFFLFDVHTLKCVH